MILPPFLKKGDTIAFSASARSILPEQIDFAKKYMEERGFRVKVPENLFKIHHQFSGTDQERAQLMNELLADEEVKAIWNVRGGYGSSRMVDALDIELLKRHPKWLLGFSDFTVLLNHVYKLCGMASLHASMPIFAWEKSASDLLLIEQAFESISQALIGDFQAIDCRKCEIVNPRNFEGEVIGGNLSVLMSLIGTESDVDWQGKIVFIEDLDEYLYHIDRMFLSLKRSGKLKGIKALLVGSFIQMNDHKIPFGYTVNDIIKEHCKGYDFPIVFDVNSGHHLNNQTIPFGVHTEFINGILNFATL